MRPAVLFLAFLLLATSGQAAAAPFSPADAEARLRVALQLARERNDPALAAEVERTGKKILAATRAASADPAPDAQLRALETKVGLDPGGWSMAGQPLFHPTPEMLARAKPLGPRLAAAMRADDPASVRAVTAELLTVLGDQAGVPDGRRAGARPAPRATSEAEATRLFFAALDAEAPRVRPLLAGKPAPDQMLRFYAYLLDATTTIRPFAATHEPSRLPELDRLARALAKILTDLQQPAGHFPFPDLRGKNLRFGAMTERQLAAGQIEVRAGWILSPDPEGGSQFDTGVCGVALLRAGRLHGEAAWTHAGLRAAAWALGEPCCANFNYNAFSVSLFAHAFGATGEARFLDAALRKFRVGVAPGQAPNGRWLDAHNARTVYHLILLRALADLAAALPAARAAERAEVLTIARPAVRALLDEFDAMGHTVEALPELQTLAALFPADARLRDATALMAAGLVAKSTDGRRAKMGAAPHQLAAVVLAAPANSAAVVPHAAVTPTASSPTPASSSPPAPAPAPASALSPAQTQRATDAPSPANPATTSAPQKFLPLPGEIFTVAGHAAFLIPAPATAAEKSKPWVWYAPTLPRYPDDAEKWMFEQFLAAGIAIAGIDAGESYGSPAGCEIFSALHAELTTARGYSTKPVLLGRSRGGLQLLNWAVENPTRVAAFAGIYPVCNLASYPGLAKAAPAYALTLEKLTATLAHHNPIDRLASLAAARIPLFAIHGDADKLVPLDLNSALLRDRYHTLGGPMELIIPAGQGHSLWEGFFRSPELLAFVLAHAAR
ncbi:MAG: hypothetical protein RLZZ15_2963 [Verrucomicrobiota bacterium]|jgi:hypothetical protein